MNNPSQDFEPVARKISYGEYFRFWSSFNGKTIPTLLKKEIQHSISFQKMDRSSLDTVQEINSNSQVRKDGLLHPTGKVKYTSDSTKSRGKHMAI